MVGLLDVGESGATGEEAEAQAAQRSGQQHCVFLPSLYRHTPFWHVLLFVGRRR